MGQRDAVLRVAIRLRRRLTETVVSYAGRLEIGLVGDAEHVPDGWEIVEAIEEEFAAMVASMA